MRELERARRLIDAPEWDVEHGPWCPRELRRLTLRDPDAGGRSGTERVEAFVDRVREAHDHELHSLPTCLLGVEGLMTEAEAIAVIARARNTLASAGAPPDCRYHVDEARVIDWKSIAELACDVVQHSGPRISGRALDRAAERLGSDTERDLLWSLFAEPILWRQGSPRLGNGQHRVCGLVMTGADRVPVAAE